MMPRMTSREQRRRERERGRERLGILGRIVAFRLQSNVYALTALTVLTVVSIVFYLAARDQEGFAANLWLALATSLMASVLVLASETFVKYRQHRNDIFLEGITKLGISNLHFDRRALLSELLEGCDRRFWAVGYRHILTSSLGDRIEAVADRGVAIRLLIVPPWSTSFQLVYGPQERVTENYVSILRRIVHGRDDGSFDDIEVRFVEQPLFNDTYLVDDVVVTGPYMHNVDRDHGKITANDFFTYELHRSSRLHELVLGEYETLWGIANVQLDWDLFTERLPDLTTRDLNDAERQEILREACVPIRTRPPTDADSAGGTS